MAETSTTRDFSEQADALIEAMLRNCRSDYRKVVRVTREFEKRLADAQGESARAMLQTCIDKLKALRATMTPPAGYQTEIEG